MTTTHHHVVISRGYIYIYIFFFSASANPGPTFDLLEGLEHRPFSDEEIKEVGPWRKKPTSSVVVVERTHVGKKHTTLTEQGEKRNWRFCCWCFIFWCSTPFYSSTYLHCCSFRL